ncbi:MAG TPA: hypothetical protein VLN49_10915 [Gemmatimonadaceae bacterium]|nr:hypothetical protein [Gemmatimonadaceae bacterium]
MKRKLLVLLSGEARAAVEQLPEASERGTHVRQHPVSAPRR